MMKNLCQCTTLIIFFIFCTNAWSTEKKYSPDLASSSAEKRSKIITIQVAAFKDKVKANRELERLKAYELESFSHKDEIVGKGFWYRIYVGAFKTWNQAEKYAHNLKKKGIISEYWVKSIITIPEVITPKPASLFKPTEKPDPMIGHEKDPKIITPAPVELAIPTPPPEKIPLTPSPAQPIDKYLKIEEETILVPSDAEEERLSMGTTADEHEAPKQSGIAAQSHDRSADENRFSLGIRSSYFHAPKADSFVIRRESANSTDAWSFDNENWYNAIVSSFRLSPKLSLEVYAEGAVFTKLKLWHLTMGPKFDLKRVGPFTPYIRGNMIIGYLDWDDIPGDFDSAIGWEGGLGLFFIKSNFQIGIEAACRDIEYDYNSPSDETVTASDSSLDFTGYSMSIILSYLF